LYLDKPRKEEGIEEEGLKEGECAKFKLDASQRWVGAVWTVGVVMSEGSVTSCCDIGDERGCSVTRERMA